MIIGFIGSACSGKSTCAVSMFSQFKLSAQNCELILERAREYISLYRLENNLDFNSPVILTDEDQLKISKNQFNIEKAYKQSCGPNTIIISDSSVLNSLLYMSDNYINENCIKEFLFNNLKNHYDLLFYCFPIEQEFLPSDSNRVHNKEQLKLIEERAKKLLNELKQNNFPVEVLLNDSESRIRDACSYTMSKYCKILETTPEKVFEKFV